MSKSLALALATVLLCSCSSDPDDTPPDSTCPEGVTDHSGVVAADERWDAGVHTVSSHLLIGDGATVTIEPCATVRLSPDVTIEVSDEASLEAVGTATEGIVFEPATNDAWGSLAALFPASIRLEHVTLRGGGTTTTPSTDATYAGATLVGRNQTETVGDAIFVRDVRIEGTNGLGVMLQGSGFAAGSDGLVVTGAGLNPIYVGAGHATTLPEGEYTGNGDDQFLLQSVGAATYDNVKPILADATLPNRGLPYLVGTEGTSPSISVGDGREESPAATLTIEAGVELRFQGGETTMSQLLVRGKRVGDDWVAQGTLVAEGTAEQPIVLTSAEPDPQPGDWQGLYFQYVVAASTSLSHVRVAYAGGESTTTGLCVASVGAQNNDADCSVVLFLEEPPGSQFITDSEFAHGLGCGIYRGWTGADVDFTSTNTFTDLTGCGQSDVHDGSECIGTCE